MAPKHGNGEPDSVRAVAVVVAGLSFVFVAVLLAVQFGGGRAGTILTVPLVILTPVLVSLLYWRYKTE